MDYYEAVIHSDINRADGVNKNPERVRRLMRAYARNQGTQAANTMLAADITNNDDGSTNEETVAAYVSALKKSFVVEDLLSDLKTFGFLFEALCVRDLRIFADALGGSVYHYRNKDGLECDAVLHLRNGSYGLIEIKLGGDMLIEDGAKSLRALSEKIDTQKMKPPAFLMVLTATGDYPYR